MIVLSPYVVLIPLYIIHGNIGFFLNFSHIPSHFQLIPPPLSCDMQQNRYMTKFVAVACRTLRSHVAHWKCVNSTRKTTCSKNVTVACRMSHVCERRLMPHLQALVRPLACLFVKIVIKHKIIAPSPLHFYPIFRLKDGRRE